MIQAVRGVYLDTEDAKYLVDAMERLIGDVLPKAGMRPNPKLQMVTGQLRKSVDIASKSRSDTSGRARIQRLHEVSPENVAYAYMSVNEAARVLGITANGVRDLARRGRLRGRKVGSQWILDASAVIERAER